MPLYFAYGSNLDTAAMGRRCPGSRPLGLARLDGYNFFIMAEGYASVRARPGATVHGLLWDLAEADLPALDAYEEVEAGLYSKATLPVHAASGPVQALVYQGRSHSTGTPRPGYMEAVLAAAHACGLPESCRAELRRWLTSPP